MNIRTDLSVFYKFILSKIGIDLTIGYTLLTRLIQALGSVGVIIVITKYLDKEEQGYYYTFTSIIAIQVFFELGLSGIITQYTAHEFAHLKFDNNHQLVGEDIYISRLASLLQFCVKWFGIIAFFLFFLLVGIGFYFFSTYNNNYSIDWKWPWIILSLSTSLNLFIDPILAFFDGLNEIKEMTKIRLIQKSVNVFFLYGTMILGFKLYSSPIASILSVLIVFVIIGTTKKLTILKYIWKQKTHWVINYHKEIFPFQWRIALSWVSGYFIFQIFNPVLFATAGPIVAGQMGMTLQVLGGISSISMSWITTKIPLFSMLISKKEFIDLDKLFDKTLKSLCLVISLLVLTFTTGIFLINYLKIPLRNRFLPILPLLLMSSTVIINQIIYSWATYLRCHKLEPYLFISIVGAIYCTISTVVLSHFYGLLGMVIGYTIWTFTSIFWAYNIFYKKKTEWHQYDI